MLFDARTGRRRDAAGVGAAGMVSVVSGVWLLTAGGHAVDVPP